MRHLIKLCAVLLAGLSTSTMAAVQKMGEPSPFYENLLTFERGASIRSDSELQDGFDLRTIIDPVGFPGPAGGTVIFADREQRESFVVDLGKPYENMIVFIRTHPGDGPVHGNSDGRRPRALTVQAAADKPGREWVTLQDWHEPGSVPRKHSVAWGSESYRYLQIDLGRNTDAIGSRFADLSMLRRYRLPSLQERLADLDALLRTDVEGLAPFRAARARGDDPGAVSALRQWFASKPVETVSASDKHGRYAEEWLDNIVRFDDRTWKIPGGRFDWHFIPCDLSDEPPSYWIAGVQFWYLPDYYQHHPDPKYARAAARMIRDWMAEVPCPGMHRLPWRGKPLMWEGWPAIRTANRTGAMARAAVVFAGKREQFDDDTWAQLLYAVWEHAAFLAHVSPELGGNWLTWANERLLLTARDFPEFRDQPGWLEVGRRTYETVVRRDVTESGKECEDSTYYCLRAMKEIVNTFGVFESAGVELPQDVSSRVRAALDFPAWVHQPGFRNPGIGDMGTVGDAVANIPLVHEFASKWGRDDLVYIDTGGRQGRKPQLNSRAFLPDGWFILRSGWDDGLNARHLVFRAPPANCRGHGHADVLALTLYAYGRPLLIDPGMTLYGVKGSDAYAATSLHNTVVVDGRSQPHGPGSVNAWESTDDYDIADAEHRLYAGVPHRRRVIFVKPACYVVVDDFEGQGSHTLEWNYHFLEGARPALHGGSIRTGFASGGNLAIIPLILAEGPVRSEPKPFRYVVPGAQGGREVNSIGWRVQTECSLPQRTVTLLVPFDGPAAPEDLDARLIAEHCLEMRHGDVHEIVAWMPNSGPGTWTVPLDSGEQRIEGRHAAVVRYRKAP